MKFSYSIAFEADSICICGESRDCGARLVSYKIEVKVCEKL